VGPMHAIMNAIRVELQTTFFGCAHTHLHPSTTFHASIQHRECGHGEQKNISHGWLVWFGRDLRASAADLMSAALSPFQRGHSSPLLDMDEDSDMAGVRMGDVCMSIKHGITSIHPNRGLNESRWIPSLWESLTRKAGDEFCRAP
jgi:hypothetical protein